MNFSLKLTLLFLALLLGHFKMGKKRRRTNVYEEQPPEGCHHYDHVTEVPWDIQKFASLFPSIKIVFLIPNTGTFINATPYFQDMMRVCG